MLLIPIVGKISRKTPPYVTIFLIVLNVLVFALFQWNDEEKIASARHYYVKSDLSKIEAAYYVAYVDAGRRLPIPEKPMEKGLKAAADRISHQMLARMFQDDEFQTLLQRQKIIEPGDALFEKWRRLKTEFEKRLDLSAVYRFGLKPADPKWYAFITCMFLHGGIGHLLGNMIFLWLVGCFLEMGCGKIYYSVLYILSGMAASVSFIIIYPDSAAPLVGASGAIAGAMGAFAVLFGRKKVEIFFSLGFYFGYRRMPAMLLLPLWLGNEGYQLFFSGISHIAYVAHIGGIIAGAALGFLNLKKIGAYDLKVIEAEPEDDISPLIEKALGHLSRLETDEGCRLLEQVLLKDPSNTSVMIHLFNTLRNEPQNSRFHSLSQTLLDQLSREPSTYDDAIKMHADYLKAAGKSMLALDTTIRMSMAYAHQGHPERAEPLLAAVLKRKPNLSSIPPALLRLAEAYRKKSENRKHAICLKILIKNYPDTYEAQLARRMPPSSISA